MKGTRTPKQKVAWVRSFTLYCLTGMKESLRSLEREWVGIGVSPEWLYDLDVSV